MPGSRSAPTSASSSCRRTSTSRKTCRLISCLTIKRCPSSRSWRTASATAAFDIRLATRGQSPAGAGIAGSSALNVAVCGALAAYTRQTIEGEALLDIAKDVEAQVIKVPTGLQDYRPAFYGGIAAVELHPGGPTRVELDVDARELERRIVLC